MGSPSVTSWSATPPTASVPKETRAKLHRRFARWLESKAGDAVEEYERGHRLSPRAVVPIPLGARSARRHAIDKLADEAPAASPPPGGRAFARGTISPPRSTCCLARWLSSSDDDPLRLGIMPDLGAALAEAGDLERARESLRGGYEAIRDRRRRPRLRHTSSCSVGSLGRG